MRPLHLAVLDSGVADEHVDDEPDDEDEDFAFILGVEDAEYEFPGDVDASLARLDMNDVGSVEGESGGPYSAARGMP